MNIKDKLILYLDNRMTPPEKIKFEEELKNSPELLMESEKLKRSLQKLNELNIHTADQTYFVNNIPSFREKLEPRRKALVHKRMIYASSAAVIILLVISLFLIKNGGAALQESISVLSDEQLNNLAQNYSILESDTVLTDVADSVWDDLIVDELSFSYEYADSILNSFNGDIIYADYLNDEEASLVYDRLVNKEFF